MPTAGSEDAIAPWARAAIAQFDVTDLCEEVISRCLAEVFPAYLGDAAFVAALRDSVYENVGALRDVLCGRLEIDQVTLRRRLALADVQARLHVPQHLLQRSYRLSFVIQWEAWADLLHRTLVRLDVPRDPALAAQTRVTRLVLTYQNRVVSQVAEKFARSEDAFNRSRAHIRQRLVRDILHGDDVTPTPSDLVLIDYDLDAEHLAILLPDTSAGVDTVLNALRAAVRPRRTLSYPPSIASTVVWLAAPGGWPDEKIETVRATLTAAGVTASISEPAAGVAGFRHAFEQARRVERLRPALRQNQVIRHADMGLELLLMQDRELAEAFVTKELGPLARRTSEAAKLRETLDASFQLGSHVAVAKHLRLHEHTVRNRLHKIETKLGVPVRDRRTELEVALRLHRLLANP
ncbi:PucR family transcriptional regulator [Pseudonocardia acaciae]|uniref:PucR family transcriptional regulator n=1 Tax=Pseudonocardia acaciae TaxID=551276 RepID=UPI00048D97B3|nr:helix-turn-helix domain-containing protein [Pseudonocardia acaciae]